MNADSVAGKKVELNIANYGAQANNPNFDNGPIISRLINDLPKSGGQLSFLKVTTTLNLQLKLTIHL